MLRLLLAALALGSAACSGGEEAAYRRALEQATKEARAQLPFFWEHYRAPLADAYDFRLKVEVEEASEPVWVEEVAGQPEAFTALVAADAGGLSRGAVVAFAETDIVDWAFVRGEELLGHYTTRVMLPRLPPDQADALRSMFGENPS
jgi:uncharacterized protein YegJ (DUF2314 family)